MKNAALILENRTEAQKFLLFKCWTYTHIVEGPVDDSLLFSAAD
jgi:hypothetical protein